MTTIFAETTFRGVPYRLQRLPRMEAARLALAVGRLIAAAAEGSDAVAALIAAAKQNPTGAEKQAAGVLAKMSDDSSIVNALAGGVAKLDTDALYAIGLKCVSGLFGPDGRLGDNALLEAHFEKYPDHLLPIMGWAIKENCLGFFVSSAQG